MADDQKMAEYLSYFNRDAVVIYQGKEYCFTEADFKQLNRSSNYWHHQNDPSSWLCEATVNLGKRKFKNSMPRKLVIELCALTLNIDPKKLESSLNWNANYMAWHEGGTPEEFHAWEEKEEK